VAPSQNPTKNSTKLKRASCTPTNRSAAPNFVVNHSNLMLFYGHYSLSQTRIVFTSSEIVFIFAAYFLLPTPRRLDSQAGEYRRASHNVAYKSIIAHDNLSTFRDNYTMDVRGNFQCHNSTEICVAGSFFGAYSTPFDFTHSLGFTA